MALHFLAAAFGLYLLCRKIKIGQRAAFLAGLIFAFSGVLPIRADSQSAIFFGLCLIPYPLFFMLNYYEKQKYRWLLYSGLSLGLIVLAGHIQPYFHALLLLLIIELSRLRVNTKPLLKGIVKPMIGIGKRLSIIVAASVAVALPQLLLSYQYLPNAYRIQASGYQSPDTSLDYAHFAKPFNVDPSEFANLIEPKKYPVKEGNNLYIGLLPLGIIILALIYSRKKIVDTEAWRENGKFIVITLVFSILAMLGYWTWFAAALYEVPFVKQVRQLGRYSIMFHLAITIIFSMALEAINKVKLTNKQSKLLKVVATFMLLNGVYLFLLRSYIFELHFALQTLILAIGIGAVAYYKPNGKKRPYILALLIVLSTIVNSLWFLPDTKADVRMPSDYKLSPALVSVLESTHGKGRIEIVDNALPVNIANAYNFESTGGYGATIYAPFYEFSHKINASDDFKRDLLGVKYLVSTRPSAGDEVYADPGSSVYVVGRKSSLSKIFYTTKEGSLVRADYHPLDVNTEVYTDSYQRYKVNMTESRDVIISEVQYPGWHIKIDGKSAEWFPYIVDGVPIFRTFNLSQGQHMVEFEYRPFGI